MSLQRQSVYSHPVPSVRRKKPIDDTISLCQYEYIGRGDYGTDGERAGSGEQGSLGTTPSFDKADDSASEPSGKEVKSRRSGEAEETQATHANWRCMTEVALWRAVLLQAISDRELPKGKELNTLCDLADIHPDEIQRALSEGRIYRTVTQARERN